MKITRFALPGKCGALGASEFSSPRASSDKSCEKTAGNMIEPQNSDLIISRLEWLQQSLSIVLSALAESIYIQKLVTAQQHPQIARERRAIPLIYRRACGFQLFTNF